ncbi:CoA-transferase [Paenibacillus cellulositrophicus]|uniref:CoA-transferase n=1 Tax=Paenibacillus cellulositrophicus TaxID=562959 RepID=UPI001266FEF2|nr:CoA-transferase [Paenibacillus cellulositrophicus]
MSLYSSYSEEEWLICLLSRQLKDHEVVAVGNNSPIPAAASLLARALHARQTEVYILGQPDWPFEGTKEFFDWMQRGTVDVFFLSGAQIDRSGNINLHVIGNYEAPKVRLPGGAGSAVVYFMCKRILLFKTDHTRKGFPEKLDFVTSVARSSQDVFRRGQLEGVFTPLGILKPQDEDHLLRLTAVAPGVTASEVQAQTGFDLGIERGDYLELQPPTSLELNTLRSAVAKELQSIYPEFAKQWNHSA